MFLLSNRKELGAPADIAGRVHVDVPKGVVGGDADSDAGDFRTPEEIPVFLHLEPLVPADGLQNVAVGDKTLTDVMAPSERVVEAADAYGDVQDSIRHVHQT